MEKAACVRKEAVAAPEEAPPTLTAPPTLMAPEKEPEKCYKKTMGEEATFLESAKDYFNQFKAMPAQKHWICLKNYFSQKCSSVMSLPHLLRLAMRARDCSCMASSSGSYDGVLLASSAFLVARKWLCAFVVD